MWQSKQYQSLLHLKIIQLLEGYMCTCNEERKFRSNRRMIHNVSHPLYFMLNSSTWLVFFFSVRNDLVSMNYSTIKTAPQRYQRKEEAALAQFNIFMPLNKHIFFIINFNLFQQHYHWCVCPNNSRHTIWILSSNEFYANNITSNIQIIWIYFLTNAFLIFLWLLHFPLR